MAAFIGRSRDLGALRGLLDAPLSSVVRVTGPPGVGKSALVRRALRDYPGLYFVCPPLPAPIQAQALHRALLAHAAGEAESFDPAAETDTPTWEQLATTIDALRRQSDRPWVLVLDDADRLQDARARYRRALATLRADVESVPPVHIVLISRDAAAIEAKELGDDAEHLPVAPLTLREAAPFLPGNRPHHRLRAYAAFGGSPRVLSALDNNVTVGTNVRRLLLDPNGALADLPLSWLERLVQTPSRYAAILSVLADGSTDWSTIHEGVPDLSRSGQLAPYLNRLSALGWLDTRVSVDAKPGSRARRYEVPDPFVRFWFRFVLPWRLTADPEAVGSYYTRVVRPGIETYMDSVMPTLARQHMAHSAIEVFGASARVTGGLWGDGVDIPVAGVLGNGSVFYGTCAWHGRDGAGDRALAALEEDVAHTRYGFGRQGRHRVIFTGRPAPTSLKRTVARRRDTLLVDARALLGTGR